MRKSVLEIKAPEENNFHELEVVIRPPSHAFFPDFRELFAFRHLLLSMVWRDIRLNLGRLHLGFFWASATPLAMMFTFALLKAFSRANLYETIPYSIYFYSGIIVWFYFLESTSACEQSLAKDAGLIKKIYYPRVITPLVPILSNLYTLALASLPLICMMAWKGVYPGWRILLLPFVLVQIMFLSFGTGMIFASLSLFHRDYQRLLGILLYLGLFVSPVIYSTDMIPAHLRVFYFLNPVAGSLLAVRSCLFGAYPFPLREFAYSCVASLAILACGLAVFTRTEAYFADEL